MNDTELIKQAYEAIGNTSPLKSDCGRLCGAACCKGEADSGMLLFPGEEVLYENERGFTTVKTEYGMPLLLCEGKCQRDKRPLSCRIFPLAIINKNGTMRAIVDSRSRAMCPLYSQAVNGRLNPMFVKAVKRSCEILSQSDNIKDFAAFVYRLCLEFTGL